MKALVLRAMTRIVCALIKFQTWLAGEEAKTTRERAKAVADELERLYGTKSWWRGVCIDRKDSCGWYVIVMTSDRLLTSLHVPVVHNECYVFSEERGNNV